MRKSISLIHTVKISQLSKAIRVLSLIIGLSALATTQTAHASPDDDAYKAERDCVIEKRLVHDAVNFYRTPRSMLQHYIALSPYFTGDILKTFPMRRAAPSKYWMADQTWLLSSWIEGRSTLEFVYEGYLSLSREADYFPVIIMDNFQAIADGHGNAPTHVTIHVRKLGGYSKTKIKACVIRVARTPLAWKPWSNQDKFIHEQLNAAELSDAERARILTEDIPVEWTLESMNQTFPAFPRKNLSEKRLHLKLPRDRKRRLDSIYVVMIKATHNNPFWSPTVEIFVDAINEYPLK